MLKPMKCSRSELQGPRAVLHIYILLISQMIKKCACNWNVDNIQKKKKSSKGFF